MNIEGYAGVKLGGEMPSGDLWVERSGMMIQVDTLSVDPQMLFAVAVAPHNERVGFIAVTKSVLEEDLVGDWEQWIRELTAEHGSPDTLIERADELKFSAGWEDGAGDQVAATVMPAHERGHWHIVVGYSWHEALAAMKQPR